MSSSTEYIITFASYHLLSMLSYRTYYPQLSMLSLAYLITHKVCYLIIHVITPKLITYRICHFIRHVISINASNHLLNILFYWICHSTWHVITYISYQPTSISSQQACHHLHIFSLTKHVIPHWAGYLLLGISSPSRHVITYASYYPSSMLFYQACHHLRISSRIRYVILQGISFYNINILPVQTEETIYVNCI